MRLNSIQLDKHQIEWPGLPPLPGCQEDLTRRAFLSSKRYFMAVWNCRVSVPLRCSSSVWGWYKLCSRWFAMAAWTWNAGRVSEDRTGAHSQHPAKPPNSLQRLQAGSLHTLGGVGSKIFNELPTFKIQEIPHKIHKDVATLDTYPLLCNNQQAKGQSLTVITLPAHHPPGS